MSDALLLVAGLALLTFAADRFVMGAARLSTALRISPVVVGAVVIGFGTSAPELLVSVLATVRGAQDIAFGNVVGSNIANVLLVLGAAAVIRPLGVAGKTLRRELPLMLVAITALALTTADLEVHGWEGLLLLAGALAAFAYIGRTAAQDRESLAEMRSEVEEYEGGEHSLRSSVLLTVAGLLGTLAGAQLLVEGAVGLSRALGISEAVIGLTIVAIGTSLPELVTAIAAARRNETDLVIGNVLGSNLFNSLLVAGASGALDTVKLDASFRFTTVVMVLANTVIGVLLARRGRLTRIHGVLFLVAFVAVSVALF